MNTVDIVKKLNNLEYLTKKQHSWLQENDSKFDKNDFHYIGDLDGDYLNLQVYSEHEHHDFQYRMECGI